MPISPASRHGPRTKSRSPHSSCKDMATSSKVTRPCRDGGRGVHKQDPQALALLPSSRTQRRYQALVHWYLFFLVPAHHYCQLSVSTDGERGSLVSAPGWRRVPAAGPTSSSPGITKITPAGTYAQPSGLNPEYQGMSATSRPLPLCIAQWDHSSLTCQA